MKISIITPSFNSESTLLDTINSFNCQDYKTKEHLIIDGGSSDGTSKIINDNIKNISYFISEPDAGLYDAMNKGIKKATGEIIGILNSDDFFYKSYVLSDIAKIFQENPKIDLVFGGIEMVNPSNIDIPIRSYRLKYFKPWMLRFGIMPPHPAVFIRKKTYIEAGEYKQKYSIAADFEMIVRLLFIKKVKYILIDSVFVRMRTGGLSNSNGRSLFLGTKEINLALRDNGIYSNILMVLFRLPFKFFTQKLSQFKLKLK